VNATRRETQRLFAEHVSPGKVRVYREYGIDVVMGEREGPRFRDAYDPERWWWNCHCNGGVFNLGHRNPRIVAALERALSSLDIGNHHLVSEARARCAAQLAASTGGALPGVVFGVSGGEAVDLAIKVARAHTGRQTIVSVRGGYHGHTGLALATGDPQFRDPFGPNPPGFVQVPFDDLDALDAAVDDGTAAFIVEPIPATLGMPIPSAGYLADAADLVRSRGAVFIADEVQTGLARTGRVWAYEHEGFVPDVLVTGKGLGGGVYPISATLMTRELHRLFDPHPFVHVSTFGGSELGCVVASEVLDLVTGGELTARVGALAARFATAFSPLPFGLRQRGLMMGFEFPVEAGGLLAAKMLYEAGVYAMPAGNDSSVLQFLPPLILTDTEADTIADCVVGAFS
jgi:acetylornithine/succinyldiaminopimelate/putrescine aminotransferase